VTQRAVFAAAVLAFVSLTPVQASWPIDKIVKSLGRFSAPYGEGRTTCTAVAISREIALTAAHCIPEDKASRDNLFIDEQRVSVPLEITDLDENGIVPLRADREAFVPIALAPKPKVGDSLLVIGYGMNAPVPLFFSGELIVHEMTAPGEDAPYFLFTSMSGMVGMSGGPVVDTRGRLVSIHLGGFDSAGPLRNVGYSAAYELVKTTVEKYRK
jgi:V8-like Glu-specific endopeptidase